MYKRDIVVIGASAGGVEALLELVDGLPLDFPAAIVVVAHTSPIRPNRLHQVLNYQRKLPAYAAQHGQTIEPGHIYVAPSNLHLVVHNNKLELNHGPHENSTRPAIDPLFRSAARNYGRRVIGIILSGNMGDGTTGLMMIKSYGGVAVVQTPQEAIFPSMPQTAIDYGQVDYILPVKEMPSLLVRLVGEALEEKGVAAPMKAEVNNKFQPASPHSEEQEEARPAVINEDLWEQEHNQRSGKSATFSCPDCGGVLWQIEDNYIVHFQCHVGHRLSPEVLLIKKSEELETALWSCVRTLQEKISLNRQLASHLRERGNAENAARIEEKIELDQKTSKILREQILDIMPNSTEQSYGVLAKLEHTTTDYIPSQPNLDSPQ